MNKPKYYVFHFSIANISLHHKTEQSGSEIIFTHKMTLDVNGECPIDDATFSLDLKVDQFSTVYFSEIYWMNYQFFICIYLLNDIIILSKLIHQF